MHSLPISEFNYSLPHERIAVHPLPERDQSKLLIYQGGNISEDIYKNIAEHIPADSLMIFNDTRVVEARIRFQKPSGGVVEIFCLAPHDSYVDMQLAMSQKEKVLWYCLVGGASKWKRGQVLQKEIINTENKILLEARYVEKRNEDFVIELSWNADISFAEVLHFAGEVPLPPYLQRSPDDDDKSRYQTVFAKYDGSVAAPTAGLHFTSDVFDSLKAKNVALTYITLHVGAGTFRPVKTEDAIKHVMHEEVFTVEKNLLEKLLNKKDQKVIAVGTTALRTLESIYWLGVKKITGKSADHLHQWECYELPQHISFNESLNALLHLMSENNIQCFNSKTQLMIVPGYKVRVADLLVTNFHLPKSTLLLLVAALIGDDWKKVYDYALENDFRFLSYGDGSLLWIPKEKSSHTLKPEA